MRVRRRLLSKLHTVKETLDCTRAQKLAAKQAKRIKRLSALERIRQISTFIIVFSIIIVFLKEFGSEMCLSV